jgi:RecA-family ATPase
LVALVGAPPDVASLPSTEEWFAQPEPATRWRIEGLVEEGHNLLLGGKTKVSKTTLTVDLARALTNDEERWLDEFALSPPTGQVGWINCEMTEAHFRRWLRSAGVNPSRLSVLDLRGNVPNFLDPDWWRKSATGWSPRTFPSWSWTRSGLSAPC